MKKSTTILKKSIALVMTVNVIAVSVPYKTFATEDSLDEIITHSDEAYMLEVNEQDIDLQNTDIQYSEERITDIQGDESTYTIPEEWKGLEYAVYTSSEEQECFYVNTSEIKGSVHTNGDFIFHGNRLMITDALETCGEITLRTSDVPDSQAIGERMENMEFIEMPALSSSIHDKIFSDNEENWEIRSEDICLGSNELALGNNLYVDGMLTMNATKFTADKAVVAKRDINYNTGSICTGEDTTIFISSEEGGININGGNIKLNAVLYAPEGTVTFNVNELDLNGRIIARKLVVNGTTIRIKAGAHDYDLLAEMGLFKREIIKEYDSMQDFLAEQDMKNDYDEYIPAIMDNTEIVEHCPYPVSTNEINDEAGLTLVGMAKPEVIISKSYDFDGMNVTEKFNGTYISDENVSCFEGTLELNLDHDEIPTSMIAYNKGHAYAVSDDKRSWKEAKEVCENLGGHLAVTDDKAENDYICALINSQGKGYYTAIGYTDEVNEGRWQWVNGSDSRFTNWNWGEPNDGLSLYAHQNYAYMYSNGTWDDGQGEGAQYYVCEWDELKDTGVFSSPNAIVRFTLDADADISADTEGNYKVYEQPTGEKVILWKVPADGNGELKLPLTVFGTNKNISVLRDTNVFYRENNEIRTEKLDDIELSPVSYAKEGTWSTIYDSGHDNAEWTYFDFNGSYPNDSDIRLFAFASNDPEDVVGKRYSTDIKEITLEEAGTYDGVSGIEGRYLLIRAEFICDSDGRTPFLDSIIAGANTNSRAVTTGKNRFVINNITDDERNKPVTKKEKYIDFEELISGLNSFPVFNMYTDKTSYVSGETVNVKIDGTKGNDITILYDDKETDCRMTDGIFSIENVSAGEHKIKVIMTNAAGNSFSREIVFPVYASAPKVRTWFDKDTYFSGDNVELSVEDGYAISECKLDSSAENMDISDDGSSVMLYAPAAGLHTININLNKEIDISIYLFINDALIISNPYDGTSGIVDDDSGNTESYKYGRDMSDSIRSAEAGAIEWLISQKDTRGRWNPGNLMNATCDALAVLKVTGKSTDSAAYDEWITGRNAFNVDEMCHALWVEFDEEAMNSLWSMQNPDGGFGLTNDYQSDPYDTMLVLITEALAREADYIPADEEAVKQAVSYISGHRNDDGGIGYSVSDRSRAILTAECACAIKKLGYKLVTDQSMYSYCRDLYTGSFDEESFDEQCMIARYLQLCGAYEWDEKEMQKILDAQDADGSIHGSIKDTMIFIMLMNEACVE